MKVITKGHNVIKELKYILEIPNLMNQWNLEKNTQVNLTANSLLLGNNKLAWWKCPLGHEWQACIIDSETDITKCPICSARRQTSFPKQAIFYYVKNSFLTQFIDIKIYFKIQWSLMF